MTADPTLLKHELIADDWKGLSDQGYAIKQPSPDQIEQAVRELNGDNKTLVPVGIGGEAHLAVGGGADGQYVVYATFDNQTFHNLLGHADEAGTVLLNVGGQEGEYPANTVVGIDVALVAVKSFSRDRGLDPSLNWREEQRWAN